MAKKPNKLNGFFLVVIGVALLLFASWIFALGGALPSPSQVNQLVRPSAPSVAVNETYSFITYRNPQWGFELDYPVGFFAEEPLLELSVFKAYAGVTDKPPEVIEVIVDNSTTASAEFAEIIATASQAGATQTREYATISGENVRLAITETAFPLLPEYSNQSVTIFQAVYTCQDNDVLPYVALLLINIPDEFQQDIPVAQHVVDSFKC